MDFKIGQYITYKDETLLGVYIVVSEDPKEFWMQNKDHENVFLRYSPDKMKIY